MKTSFVARLSLALMPLSLATGGAVALSTTMVACADENAPETWVKRLDDPAQRATAIQRLSGMFEKAMTDANKNRSDPKVKELLDKIVEPLTKQYTGTSLDEKTRKELIKFIADTRDPRAMPAFSKAFNEFEPGKNDDDVRYAAQAMTGLAKEGKATDQTAIDALWNCFAKFQPSKAKSINLVKDLADAVLAVKHTSYGPKAAEKLAGKVTDPKNPSEGMDQIQFWQATSVRIISELKYTGAAKALVTVLLTPQKQDLRGVVNNALMKMPKEAEPLLIGALNGSDPDFAKLGEAFGAEKTHLAIVADTLAWLSRPAGRDAIIDAIESAGARATERAPLAWIRLEPEALTDGIENSPRMVIDITTWPGGTRRIIGYTDGHVRAVYAQ
ncbi:MAG: hypothetical protein ABL932_19545 [Terricaulis sp.]